MERETPGKTSITGVTRPLSRQAKEFWESPGYFAFCAGGVHFDARQGLIKAVLLVFNVPSLCPGTKVFHTFFVKVMSLSFFFFQFFSS